MAINLELNKLFDQFSTVKIGVVGDVMLDTYWWGKVDRISPEAPVPIVALQSKELRIGGAGNVALNLAALGAKTAIFSVTGNDSEASDLIKLFTANKIYTRYLVKSSRRTTTNKIRVMGRNQQVVRIDSEITEQIGNEEAQLLIDNFKTYVNREKPHAIIFEDYNKGVLTVNIIHQLLQICKEEKILTAVDPKSKNFFEYKGVNIFKPNLKEVIEALHIDKEKVSIQYLKNIHLALNAKLKHQNSLITLSEHGMFFQNKTISEIIPAVLRNIADVSGAGDTVIAVATIILALSNNIKLAANVANIAGGLVCEQVGTAVISKKYCWQNVKNY